MSVELAVETNSFRSNFASRNDVSFYSGQLVCCPYQSREACHWHRNCRLLMLPALGYPSLLSPLFEFQFISIEGHELS
jgi:hypothetical protein